MPLRPPDLLRATAIAALPVLVALLTAPVVFGGGSVLPWHPVMVDLDVYRYAGEVVLRGGDIYTERPPDNGLPFLYPPFAALMAVPLTVIPQALAQIGWLVLCVGLLLAVLYRLGLDGWVLSLAGAAAVYFCEPVVGTLAYGQLGIVLVAAVVLDLVPGRRLLDRVWRRPLLPTGFWTGLVTAVKLTPGLFVVFLFVARRRAEALSVALTVLVLTAGAGLLLPSASSDYWGGLLHGDTGTESYHYMTNQSVLGTWLRVAGLGGAQMLVGLLLAVAVATLGLCAAVAWHRRGKVALAVCLGGVAGLFASPISWSHHFVWVVPLAVVLLDRELPVSLRAFGLGFVLWVTAAPFKRLPAGGDVELTYQAWEYLLVSVTALAGTGFLALAWLAALRRPHVDSDSNTDSEPEPEPVDSETPTRLADSAV